MIDAGVDVSNADNQYALLPKDPRLGLSFVHPPVFQHWRLVPGYGYSLQGYLPRGDVPGLVAVAAGGLPGQQGLSHSHNLGITLKHL